MRLHAQVGLLDLVADELRIARRQLLLDELEIACLGILGQLLALNVAAAAAITLLSLAVRGLISTGFVAALGIASLVPIAQTGHAAGTAGHAMAVNSIGLHIVAVSIWVGGLAALRRRLA